MQGTIVQINTSGGGLPKRAVAEAFVGALGLEGDRHAHPGIHGGARKAVLLISAEIVDDLIARGFPLFYGALGENLTTRGIDYPQIRIGDQIRAGEAMLEITQPRGPCSALDVYGPDLQKAIYDARVKALDPTSPKWGMSGFYARVLLPGRVRTEDIISVVAALA